MLPMLDVTTSLGRCKDQANISITRGITAALTMSGLKVDSHMPDKESGAVPATIKSLAVSMAPMESVPQR